MGILSWAGWYVSRRPASVVAALLLCTVALGIFAAQREVSGALELFATDSTRSRDQDLIEQQFGGVGAKSRIQIVFDAGEGDVIGVEGLAAATRVTDALLAAPEVAPLLAPEQRPIVSFATPLIEGLRDSGFDPADARGFAVDEAARQALSQEPEVLRLYSQDLDLEGARSQAGLMLVNLDPDLDTPATRAASEAVLDVLAQVETSGVRVLPFNGAILQSAGATATAREFPRLFGLGLLVIAGILAWNYRTVSDVLVGLGGLVMAVIWMFGIAVLLGPAYAGVSGPFTAVSNVAPVVFLGLGIDDAIQLTARYREHQAHGLVPRSAAPRALTAVGGAIVLTSATTMLGFLTNYSSPIPPVQDFGVFTAVGQLAATTIMLLLVPSVRNLLDTRRLTRRRAVRTPSLATSRLVARSAALSLRAPRLVVALALAVTVAGFVASMHIPTQFDRRDFLPEGSDVRGAITSLEALFGGDRNEQTFVLLAGDLTTPAAANALLAAEQTLLGSDRVRREEGADAVRSIAALVARVSADDPAVRRRAEAIGWTGERFAPDADVAGLYALAAETEPQRTRELVNTEGTLGVVRLATRAGQAGAEPLRDELLGLTAPLRDAGLDTRVTSQLLVNAETNDALTISGRNSIVLALGSALLLLTVYFAVRVRRPLLGPLTMTAALFVVGMVFGTMYLLRIPYNGLTVTIAAIAVGVGVTFAIHMTYRTVQELASGGGVDEAVHRAILGTGAALASSGGTTLAGFAALTISTLLPLRQFGIVSSLSILYAMVAAVMILPAVLVLWGRRLPDSAPGVPAETPLSGKRRLERVGYRRGD